MLLKLSELRKKHHLSQENIADIFGGARTTYAMYEQGHREMDYSTLLKIAEYYKVSLDYIFNRFMIKALSFIRK